MDPLSALGIAAAVVQFVDYATRTCKRVYGVLQADSGCMLEQASFEAITNEMLAFHESFMKRRRFTGGGNEALRENDEAMDAIVSEYTPLVERLIAIFLKISNPRKQSQNLKWNKTQIQDSAAYFLASLKTAFKEDEINSILNQLHKLQSSLVIRMIHHLNIVTGEVTAEQRTQFENLGQGQSQIVEVLTVSEEKLSSIQRQNDYLRHQIHQSEARARIRDEKIISAVLTLKNGESRLLSSGGGEDVAAIGKHRSVMTMKVSPNLDTAEAVHKDFSHIQDKILECLYFRQFGDRFEVVSEAHKRTYRWIFCDPIAADKPWSPFVEWLEHGSGGYWICGKAGSGKSTLVKFLCQDSRTREALGRWAKGNQLAVGSFFLWNLGTDMEKSLKGLIRSLLYDILTQRPYLIPVIMPELVRTSSLLPDYGTLGEPSQVELLRWFRRLLNHASGQFRIFLVIDGIDEYDGDYTEIIDLLKLPAHNENVKFLISSRPISACIDAFSDLPNLWLHDLTKDDIKQYAEDNLRNKFTRRYGHEWEEVIGEIVDKACGVFLWVVLVVRSLLTGLQNFDNLTELRERLEELPSDLERLYAHMLKRVPISYRHQASELFQIVLLANDVQSSGLRLTPLQLYYACPEIQTIQGPLLPLKENEAMMKTEEIVGRIRSRSMGLLETRIVNRGKYNRLAPGPTKIFYVDFIHKTAVEFLRTREIWGDMLRLTAKRSFVPARCLFRSCLHLCNIHQPEDEGIQFEDNVVWELMDRALFYASIAESSISPTPLEELDQLDEVVSYNWKCSTKCLFGPDRYLAEGHWTRGYTLSPPILPVGPLVEATRPVGFESLLVYHGLSGPLAELALTGRLAEERTTLLLHDAVKYLLEKRNVESETLQVRMATICTTLLDSGANPNDTALGTAPSPWRRMLGYAREAIDRKAEFHAAIQEKRFDHTFSKLIMSFVASNADPKRIITHAGSNVTASQLLVQLYSVLPVPSSAAGLLNVISPAAVAEVQGFHGQLIRLLQAKGADFTVADVDCTPHQASDRQLKKKSPWLMRLLRHQVGRELVAAGNVGLD